MVTILRFILIVICVSWMIQFLFRLIGPPLLDRWIKKRFTNFNEKHPYNGEREKEGKVTIKAKPKTQKDKKVDSKDGEYIDFEEID